MGITVTFIAGFGLGFAIHCDLLLIELVLGPVVIHVGAVDQLDEDE